jgi:dihydroorotase
MLATQRILRLARAAKRPIHILHVTTPAELELIAQHRDVATCEVTPQHLTLRGEEAYPRLGTCADEPADPLRACRRAVALAAAGRARRDRVRPCAAHHRGEGQGLSGQPQRHAGRADAAAADARSRRRRADDAGAADRHDQRRPAALFGLVGKGRIAAGYDADFSSSISRPSGRSPRTGCKAAAAGRPIPAWS